MLDNPEEKPQEANTVGWWPPASSTSQITSQGHFPRRYNECFHYAHLLSRTLCLCPGHSCRTLSHLRANPSCAHGSSCPRHSSLQEQDDCQWDMKLGWFNIKAPGTAIPQLHGSMQGSLFPPFLSLWKLNALSKLTEGNGLVGNLASSVFWENSHIIFASCCLYVWRQKCNHLQK